MDSMQIPDNLEVLLSPCCNITQAYKFVVGWISFERLDKDMYKDVDKNGITDDPKSSLHFIKQLNAKQEAVTLEWATTLPHLCSSMPFFSAEAWSGVWWTCWKAEWRAQTIFIIKVAECLPLEAISSCVQQKFASS